MGKSPNPEWRGTIAIGLLEIGARAHPAFGKPAAPTIYPVHRDPCMSPAEAKAAKKPKKGDKQRTAPPEDDQPRGRVQSQSACIRCGKDLRPDEICFEVTMPKGQTVQLEPDDLDAMTFEKSTRVAAKQIPADDPTVAALGFARRLYLFPEPASVETYWELFAVLQKMNLIGFIPFVALKSDRAYVAVVRPLVILPELFGEESGTGKPRKVLVLDCLGDTDTLKDPRNFPDCPGETEITRLRLSHLVATTDQSEVTRANPEECVNPRTASTIRGVRRARRRALGN